MTTSSIRAVLDALKRANMPNAGVSGTIDHLMDMLYFGDFLIREEITSGAGADQINLIGRKGEHRGPPLIFVCNLPLALTDNTHEVPPYLSPDGQRIFGSHSQSGLVDAVLKLAAASSFKPESLKRPLYVLLLSGGETYSSYLKPLLTRLLEKEEASQPGLALCYGPTSLRFCSGHSGSLVMRLRLNRRTRHRRMPPHAGFFEVQVKGRDGHCLSPSLSPEDDALAQAQVLLEQLRHSGELRLLSIEAGSTAHRVVSSATLRIATSFSKLPDLGPRAQATAIPDGTSLPFPIEDLYQAWEQANEIALKVGRAYQDLSQDRTQSFWVSSLISERDELTGLFTFWLGPKASPRELYEQLQRAIQQRLSSKDELEFELEVLQHRPAWKGRILEQERGELLRLAAQRARLPWRLEASPHPTEAAWLSDAGLDSAVFGPCGDLEAIYGHDEHIEVARLEQGLAFYRELIQAYCVEER